MSEKATTRRRRVVCLFFLLFDPILTSGTRCDCALSAACDGQPQRELVAANRLTIRCVAIIRGAIAADGTETARCRGPVRKLVVIARLGESVAVGNSPLFPLEAGCRCRIWTERFLCCRKKRRSLSRRQRGWGMVRGQMERSLLPPALTLAAAAGGDGLPPPDGYRRV